MKVHNPKRFLKILKTLNILNFNLDWIYFMGYYFLISFQDIIFKRPISKFITWKYSDYTNTVLFKI